MNSSSIYEIDPISDPRWQERIAGYGAASVFHTVGWLQALQRTYGYRPIAFTTSSPGQEITNAILCCHVSSWITGKRLVSLPFSDHCDPLIGSDAEFSDLINNFRTAVEKRRFRYFELRPRNHLPANNQELPKSEEFAFHAIDLRVPLDQLQRNLHKDSVRRKIQRAEKEGLSYERGSTPALLAKFYDLFVMTRKRHGIPPTPFAWFSNLLGSCGKTTKIRLASKDGHPVAALFTLTHNQSVVYKYGASDGQFSNLGGTPYLFWMTITESKAAGFHELDLGRSDLDNDGLITFKARLGGVRSDLTYRRISAKPFTTVSSKPGFGLAQKVLAAAPNSVRIGIGKLLYRHIG